jgi:hypothetical protein
MFWAAKNGYADLEGMRNGGWKMPMNGGAGMMWDNN